MSDSNIIDGTRRLLQEIQSELADIRDDRMSLMAILNRLDASQNSYETELRAMRSQLDRSRIEAREFRTEMRKFQDEMRERFAEVLTHLNGSK